MKQKTKSDAFHGENLLDTAKMLFQKQPQDQISDSRRHESSYRGCAPLDLLPSRGPAMPRDWSPAQDASHKTFIERKTSPTSVMDDQEDTAAASELELRELTRELDALQRWALSPEKVPSPPRGLPTTSTRRGRSRHRRHRRDRRRVRFQHPVVTSLRYRPKTLPEDCPKLYFNEEELLTLEEDRENEIPEEQVETIAGKDLSYVAVRFPTRVEDEDDDKSPLNSNKHERNQNTFEI